MHKSDLLLTYPKSVQQYLNVYFEFHDVAVTEVYRYNNEKLNFESMITTMVVLFI